MGYQGKTAYKRVFKKAVESAEESAGTNSIVPEASSFDIAAGAMVGSFSFTNNEEVMIGAAKNITVSNPAYILSTTEIGPLGPGESSSITIGVSSEDNISGVLTIPSSDGVKTVNVTSNMGYGLNQVNGLVAAYDANDVAGSDGDPVSTFPDKLGVNDAIKNDNGDLTLSSNALGSGLPAVSFGSGFGQFEIPKAVRSSLLNKGEADVFLVLNGVTTSQNAEPLGFGSSNEGELSGFYTVGGGAGVVATNFSTDIQAEIGNVESGLYSTPHILRYYYRADTGKVGMEVNGNFIGETSCSFSLGSVLYIGNSHKNLFIWEGDIAEIAIFSNYLDSTDSNLVRGYLNSKWSL